MTWLEGNATAATDLSSVLSARPELLARYEAFYSTLCQSDAVPDRLRELCRLRIAAVHGCSDEWQRHDGHCSAAELAALERGDFTAFSRDEQQALAVADTIPFNHHGLRDEQVHAVRAVLGDKGTVALLTACAFFDVVCRWKITLGVSA